MTLPLPLAAALLLGAPHAATSADVQLALTQSTPLAVSPVSVPLAPPVDPTVPAAVPDGPAATPNPPLVPASGSDPAGTAPALPGEIVVTARGKPPKSDPLQAVNVEAFKVLQAVDSAVVAPIAKSYRSIVPKPVRHGLHNVLVNLTEPIVFINYLLQLKPGKAAETLGRFAINSTIGVGGLIDVAKRKPFNLPYRVNGFSYTMAYYGIKPGPFLFLPLLGPTTARDFVGRLLDLAVLPTGFGKPFNQPYYSLGSGALKAIDERLERDDMLTTIHEDCPDPYAAERTWYLEKRQAVVEGLHGREVDLMARLPQCLADGLKARAAARAAAEAPKALPPSASPQPGVAPPAGQPAPPAVPLQPAPTPAPPPAAPVAPAPQAGVAATM